MKTFQEINTNNYMDNINKGTRIEASAPEIAVSPLIAPKKIVAMLDQFVIGQEQAKRVLAVAVHNHMKRLINPDAGLQKSNVLVMGPTGCGKTFMLEKLCSTLGIPFGVADATTLTETGYWGADVESVLNDLYERSGKDIEKTQRGIIYIDEIDKIADHMTGGSSRSVTGKGVQRSLLRIVEGSLVEVLCHASRGSNDKTKSVRIDTTNILFIVGGAFADLDTITEERIGNKSIGFHSHHLQDADIQKKLTTEDIVKYGFMPEFIGRFTGLAVLNHLSEQNMIDILSKPQNCLLEQYKTLFMLDGVYLEFTELALAAVAAAALKKGTGARGLRLIMETVLADLMFSTPTSDILAIEITADYVNEQLNKA